MNDLSIKQAADLFSDMDNWSAFFDLYTNKDKIVDIWYLSIINALSEKLNPRPDKWHFRKWQPRSWGWYADADQDSLVILYENNKFCLWIHEGRYNTPAILSNFRDKKLFSGFFEIRNIRSSGSYLALQDNAVVINNITNPDLLAWYAGHPGSFRDQFINELYRYFLFFMNDPEIYQQIQDVNALKW